MKRHFGTGRDSVSSLDWNYRPRSSIVRRLPAVADLRRHCPPVYDQLHLNGCSANAIAAALRYNELKEGRSHVSSPSRLFIYDHAKRLNTFRNSWGAAWGDGGYGYLPCAFFTSPNLTWDFWTMRRVS